MKSKGRAVRIAKPETRAPAVLRIDTIGLGKGVADAAAMEPGLDVEEYRASDRPKDKERFTNRKAEDAWSLRKKLESDFFAMKQLPEKVKTVLKAQMRAMKYEILQSGKLRVIDPDDSPDLSDAVVIAQADARPGVVTSNPEWA